MPAPKPDDQRSSIAELVDPEVRGIIATLARQGQEHDRVMDEALHRSAEMQRALDAVAALARTATEQLEQVHAAATRLSEIRSDAVRVLAGAGMTQAKIAEAIGLSRSRVADLLGATRAP